MKAHLPHKFKNILELYSITCPFCQSKLTCAEQEKSIGDQSNADLYSLTYFFDYANLTIDPMTNQVIEYSNHYHNVVSALRNKINSKYDSPTNHNLTFYCPSNAIDKTGSHYTFNVLIIFNIFYSKIQHINSIGETFIYNSYFIDNDFHKNISIIYDKLKSSSISLIQLDHQNPQNTINRINTYINFS